MPVVDYALMYMCSMTDGFRESIKAKVPITILFKKIAKNRGDNPEAFLPPKEEFLAYEPYNPDNEESENLDEPESSPLAEERKIAKQLEKELEDLNAASAILEADVYYTRRYEIYLRIAEMEATWYRNIMSVHRLAENIPANYRNPYAAEFMKKHDLPTLKAMCESQPSAPELRAA